MRIACGDALRAAADELRDAVEVPCLGRVDESLLLTLAALGVESCVLVHGGCGACACPGGVGAAFAVAERANALAVALNSGFAVEVAGVAPGAGCVGGCERVGGANGPAGGAGDAGGAPKVRGDAAASGANPEVAEVTPLPKIGRAGVLERHVPDRRKRLLKALAVLARGAGEGALEQPVPVELWGRAEVDYDRCRTCRACALFCPTGALEKFTARDDSAMGVVNTAALCVQCGCCEAVCPTGAMRVVPQITFGELLGAERVRIDMPLRPRAKDQGELMFNRMKGLLGSEYMYLR